MSAHLYTKPGFGNRIEYIARSDAISAGMTEQYHEVFINTPAAPVNTTPAVIEAAGGVTTVGTTISVTSPGVWTGWPTPVITYQWQANGTDIPGETGSSLDTTGLQVADSITVVETAVNNEGTVTQSSNAIVLT